MAAQEADPIDAIGGQEEIDVVGLADAVRLTDSLDLAGRRFFVLQVQVRQAPAMLELIQKAVRDLRRGWVLTRTWKLRHIAKISNEIEMVVAGAIPLLLDNNVDPTGARLLRRYAWSISHAARKVDGAPRVHGVAIGADGPFYSAAAEAANHLIRYSDHILRAKRTRSQAWFEANVTKLAPAISFLQGFVVTIPRSGPVDAAGGDDDDGGDDNDDGGDAPTTGGGNEHLE